MEKKDKTINEGESAGVGRGCSFVHFQGMSDMIRQCMPRGSGLNFPGGCCEEIAKTMQNLRGRGSFDCSAFMQNMMTSAPQDIPKKQTDQKEKRRL